ncbi:MAG: DAK2 domain-containing protein [candidate division WS1 bacterium]|jgi:dihydroxyacetone kinase phosphoprotein-dependent L subunit|nr:DAK2 domain-containing protein [candidate division WS1 bacterium]
MERIDAAQLIAFLQVLTEEMPAHRDRLRELDAQLGDGDLGITIAIGMKAIRDALADFPGEEPGMILAKSGMAFNREAASTFGAIFATALMSAGKHIRGKDAIEVGDLPGMVEAAASGVSARGGARPGEKTILDVLLPMAKALEQQVAAGASLPAAAQAAHGACVEAVAETEQMEAKHGRGGWLKEKSIGIPDPGSVAICLMVECLARFVEGQSP